MVHNGSEGCSIKGEGFLLSKNEAASLIELNKTYREVLAEYFGRKDVMEFPELISNRWIIDFGNLSESEAARYSSIFKIVEEKVKPAREEKGNKRTRRYWQFENVRLELRNHMRKAERYLVVTTKAKYLTFRFHRGHAIFNHNTRILYSDSFSDFAVFQSNLHDAWARWRSKSVGVSRILYSSTHAISTFPMPKVKSNLLETEGENYYRQRDIYFREEKIGSTEFYNRIHDKDNDSAAILKFRQLIESMEREVVKSYGWEDIILDFGFHKLAHLPSNDQVRFTFSNQARSVLLERLAKLNQERYEEEQAAQQLPSKSKPKAAKAPKPASAKAPAPPSLFDAPSAAGLMPEKAKQAVLAILKASNRWFKKAEVLRESGVSEAEWNLVIAGLVEEGTVERRGEKRGTEYMLKR